MTSHRSTLISFNNLDELVSCTLGKALLHESVLKSVMKQNTILDNKTILFTHCMCHFYASYPKLFLVCLRQLLLRYVKLNLRCSVTVGWPRKGNKVFRITLIVMEYDEYRRIVWFVYHRIKSKVKSLLVNGWWLPHPFLAICVFTREHFCKIHAVLSLAVGWLRER